MITRWLPSVVAAWFAGVARLRLGRWVVATRLREAGTTTAEYAVVTMAAVGFGGLLIGILRGGTVRGLLVGLVQRAFSGI